MRCLLSLDWCTPETLLASMYFDDGEPSVAIKIVDVMICRCRQALAPHGIDIATLPRRGCRMTPINKAKVLRLCVAEAEATGRDISEYSRIDMITHVWLPPGYSKTSTL